MAKKKTTTPKAERCKLLSLSNKADTSLVEDLGIHKSVQAALDHLNKDPSLFQNEELVIVTESLKVIEVLSKDIVWFYVSNPTEGESNG